MRLTRENWLAVVLIAKALVGIGVDIATGLPGVPHNLQLGLRVFLRSSPSLAPTGAQRGQSAVEYGLLIATIVVVVLLAVAAFGSLIEPWFEHLAARITTL